MENQVNDQVTELVNEPVTEQTNVPVNNQQNYPANNQQNYPVNNQQGYPMNNQQNYPVNNQQGYPMNKQQGYPMNNQQGYPMNNQPNYPMNNQPGYPMNSQPNYPMNNQPGYPMNAPMGYPQMGPAKKISARTVIFTIITTVMAIMTVVSWFLPVANFNGKAYTFLEAAEVSGNAASDAVVGFWSIMVLSFLNIVWSAIPKNWAAITGVVFTGITTLINIAQVGDWVDAKLELSAGPIMLLIFSLLLIAASIVKLVFTAGDKKLNRLNRR